MNINFSRCNFVFPIFFFAFLFQFNTIKAQGLELDMSKWLNYWGKYQENIDYQGKSIPVYKMASFQPPNLNPSVDPHITIKNSCLLSSIIDWEIKVYSNKDSLIYISSKTKPNTLCPYSKGVNIVHIKITNDCKQIFSYIYGINIITTSCNNYLPSFDLKLDSTTNQITITAKELSELVNQAKQPSNRKYYILYYMPGINNYGWCGTRNSHCHQEPFQILQQSAQSIQLSCQQICGFDYLDIFTASVSENLDTIVYEEIRANISSKDLMRCEKKLNQTCVNIKYSNNLSLSISTPFGDKINNAGIKYLHNPVCDTCTIAFSKGGFIFTMFGVADTASFYAYKKDDIRNGVSTMDVVLLTKHITGAEPLQSVYQLLAADVNNDGRISILDLVELKKVVLRISDKFTNNESWRFINPNEQAKYTIDNILTAKNLHLFNSSDKTLIGIKVGDLNGSVDVSAFNKENDDGELEEK